MAKTLDAAAGDGCESRLLLRLVFVVAALTLADGN
jgi:hypothetical protein